MKYLIIIIFLINIIITCNYIKVNTDLSKENKRLSRELKKASIRDSLYWVHLSKCSFISNDQIKVGYDNYLQLKKEN